MNNDAPPPPPQFGLGFLLIIGGFALFAAVGPVLRAILWIFD